MTNELRAKALENLKAALKNARRAFKPPPDFGFEAPRELPAEGAERK